MTLPNATTTLQLVGQDVQIYFNEISPLLVLIGIPIAIMILGVLVSIIMWAFHQLQVIFYDQKDLNDPG